MTCLNQKSTQPSLLIFRPNKKLGFLGKSSPKNFLESDADEQLIINLPFKQNVKISDILVQGLPDGSAPKEIWIFSNANDVNFDDVESRNPSQQIILTKENVEGGVAVHLNISKFTSVNSVTLFVKSNQSSTPTTKITKIDFFGIPVDGTDLSKLEKLANSTN